MSDCLQAVLYWSWLIVEARADHSKEWGATLGEMDAATEIHRLVSEWKESRG